MRENWHVDVLVKERCNEKILQAIYLRAICMTTEMFKGFQDLTFPAGRSLLSRRNVRLVASPPVSRRIRRIMCAT